MHDSFFVSCGQSMRDLNAVIDRFANRNRSAQDQLPQRAALQQFGDQIGSACKDAELVNGKDVGMIQCSCRLRFLLESTQPFGVL